MNKIKFLICFILFLLVKSLFSQQFGQDFFKLVNLNTGKTTIWLTDFVVDVQLIQCVSTIDEFGYKVNWDGKSDSCVITVNNNELAFAMTG
jgi:hypothetical protein